MIREVGIHDAATMATNTNVHADPPTHETGMTRMHSMIDNARIQTEPLIHRMEMVHHTGMTASSITIHTQPRHLTHKKASAADRIE